MYICMHTWQHLMLNLLARSRTLNGLLILPRSDLVVRLAGVARFHTSLRELRLIKFCGKSCKFNATAIRCGEI